jgi:hypothetical protein
VQTCPFSTMRCAASSEPLIAPALANRPVLGIRHPVNPFWGTSNSFVSQWLPECLARRAIIFYPCRLKMSALYATPYYALGKTRSILGSFCFLWNSPESKC